MLSFSLVFQQFFCRVCVCSYEPMDPGKNRKGYFSEHIFFRKGRPTICLFRLSVCLSVCRSDSTVQSVSVNDELTGRNKQKKCGCRKHLIHKHHRYVVNALIQLPISSLSSTTHSLPASSIELWILVRQWCNRCHFSGSILHIIFYVQSSLRGMPMYRNYSNPSLSKETHNKKAECTLLLLAVGVNMGTGLRFYIWFFGSARSEIWELGW